MRITKILASVLGLVVTIGVTQDGNASWYQQEESANDSVSRMLNEMKAKPRPVPPVVDPRDARVADLEKQLADRDRELAALRGDLSAEMAKLTGAQRGLIRALRPEIEKGNITVDLNNERLLINLTSSMLFGSGEDQLKPAGADALKRVGTILKDYPEYKVAVDGHTDNWPIRSALKKRFSTNMELSEARAANGVTALADGGGSRCESCHRAARRRGRSPRNPGGNPARGVVVKSCACGPRTAMV